MLTDSQVEQFEKDGATTVDTPLSSAELSAAIAALDRLAPLYSPDEPDTPRYRITTGNAVDEALADVIGHPFFEEVAKQILMADEVRFFQTVGFVAYPAPADHTDPPEHVDIRYGTADFESVPRRIVCSFFLWLNGVNEKRAPMMVHPGSHLLLARDFDKNDPDNTNGVAGFNADQLPDLGYAPAIPLTATPGQVSVLTTATLHGASVNHDDIPRKAMIITFTAKSVKIDLPPEQAENKRDYDRALRPMLRPERRHIVEED